MSGDRLFLSARHGVRSRSGGWLVGQLYTISGSMISTIILTGDIVLSNGNNYLSDNYLLAQKPIRA